MNRLETWKERIKTAGGVKVVHQQSTEQEDYPTLSQLEVTGRVLKLEREADESE